MGQNNTEVKSSGEGAKIVKKSFRQLIEGIDLALRFGSQEELESACNELLSNVKYDTYEAKVRTDSDFGHGMELVAFSSNPETVYTKLLTHDKEGTGATLEVTCGHCGQRDGARSLSSWGKIHKSHVKWLIDNFPEEL